MARQGPVLIGIGALVAAVAGGALFLALSDPEPVAPSPDDDASAALGTADDAESPDDATAPQRRHARVPGGAALFGVVRRADDDAPAAAQAVRLIAATGEPFEITTDSAGGFRFESLAPGGPYAVEVDAEGYAPVRLPGIALDRSEERDLGTLLLDLAVRVEVHVRDLAGRPLADADVAAFAAPEMGFGFDWSKAMAQLGQEPVAVARAETDDAGVAVFDQLAAGSWTFTARKDGYAQAGRSSLRLRSSEEPEPVVLHLARGHTLTGRVIDGDGEPLAGALVMAGGPTQQWDLGAAPLRVRTRSESDGSYTLAALAPGDTSLWAAPAGATPAQVVVLRIPDVSTFDIRLAAGGVVTGRVTRKSDGEPVEGATVRAMSWGLSGSRVAEAVTDAEGRYAIDDLPAGNVGNVTVEKSGLVQVREDDAQPGWRPQPFRQGDEVEIDLRMTPAAVLSGRVTGPGGSVAGARVVVMHQSPGNSFLQEQATTDTEGRYRVDTLSGGKFLVQASAPGLYTPGFPANWWMALQSGNLPEGLSGEAVPGEETELDLALAAGTTIAGRVETAAGEPVAAASVSAASNLGWLGGAAEPVLSAEDGTFRLDGVAPGPQVRLTARKQGLALAQGEPLSIPEGETIEDARIVMHALPVVRGRVTSATGELPDDTYVQVAAMPEMRGGMVFPPAMLAAGGERRPVAPDGSYEVTLTWAQGSFSVVAGAPGQPSASSDRVALEEGRGEYTVDLRLDEGLSLEGRVVSDVTGEGVPGAHVRVTTRVAVSGRATEVVSIDGMIVDSRESGGGQAVVAITDEAGAFRVSGLKQGDHTVSATAEGFVGATADARTPFSGIVRVPLPPEMEITGRVLLPDGSGVEGVNVMASPADGGGSGGGSGGGLGGFGGSGGGGANTTTDADGAFTLRPLARGQYVIQIQSGWGGTANVQPFTSQPIAAGAIDVVLKVQPGLRIAGRVVDDEGEPVRQCWIWANPTEQRSGRPTPPVNAQPRADGSFELVGLPADVPGYDVTFRAQGMGGSFAPVTLEGVKPGTTGLEVVLSSGLTIEGTIVGADGKPLGQAFVMARPVRREGEPDQRGSANTMLEADGSFTLGGLQAGPYALTVRTWGQGGNRELVLEGGEEVAAGSSGLRLTATPGVTITGVVVDEQGQPVAMVFVTASRPEGGRVGNARTGQDGSFELGGLENGGSYTVQVQGGAWIATPVEGVAAGSSGVRIQVNEGLRASGRALAADGSPLSRARLYLAADGASGRNARCDQDGRFTVAGLQDGVTYAVTARQRQGGAFVTLTLGTLRGGDSNVELRATE